MTIITRNWLRNDILIRTQNDRLNFDHIETYTKEDFCQFINYWKQKFISKGAKRGDKIGFCFENTEIHFYAMIFAAFELGLRVVVIQRPTTENECRSPKFNAHLPLDFFIYMSSFLHSPITSLGVRHYKKNARVSFGYGDMQWKELSNTYRSTEETSIAATPDDIAFCCSSSGTTGNPKEITYTHKFLYDLCSTNWKDLGYHSGDRIAHLSSLNHGGVITLLLPCLRICKDHFFYKDIAVKHTNRHLKLIDNCIENDITKILCANGMEINEFIDHLRNHDLKLLNTTLMMLSFICPSWSAAIEEGRLNEIVSIFGCSEICGPIFIPRMNRDTLNGFNPKLLGKPINGYHKTRICNGRIVTSLPDGREFVFDDIVEDKSEGVYFISKNRLQKINDVDINPLDIIELLERYTTRYKFEIYIDEVYNELYILTSDEKLEETKVRKDVESFYLGRVRLTVVLYEPDLHNANVSHKADKDKLYKYIEEHRKKIDK